MASGAESRKIAERVTAWRCDQCGAIAEDPSPEHLRPKTKKLCRGGQWILGDWTRRL